jgi:hypothetical protein
MPKKTKNLLKYSKKKVSRATVARQYKAWREEHGLPVRCDNPECSYHTAPLNWNGEALPVILDHKNGNRLDNLPDNLRYLCANCDSQQPTRGGKNRGRVVDLSDNSYALLEKGGTRSVHIFPDPIVIGVHVSAVIVDSQKSN